MKNMKTLALIALTAIGLIVAGCSTTGGSKKDQFWEQVDKMAPMIRTVVATEVGDIVAEKQSEDPEEAVEILDLLAKIEDNLTAAYSDGLLSPAAVGKAVDLILDEVDFGDDGERISRRVRAYSLMFYTLYYDQLIEQGQFDEVSRLLEALINGLRDVQGKDETIFVPVALQG